ncbi:hypothetical protein TIFTF001_007645 [Ficus carica]|uniref:Uncharacterized protein n=1 Tax=Ficus carica TaxID=3494 RepID=A0AA87ZTM2_FICCA|nr:hypothetical protein TIFTF001_007645 [Ficus carica]
MKKIYRGWKMLQVRTGLEYDPLTDKVICSYDTWQSFIQVHKECNHLCHEGLRNKELYYNVFEKNHAAGTSGFGSVMMRDRSNPYIKAEVSVDNSGTQTVLDEELTPTNCGRQGINRRAGDEAGPSRSMGNSDKRKQRKGTDEVTYSAMQGIMGIPLNKWTIIWHYFEAHPRVQRTFHQLPDEDRRDIIAFVVQSQSPSDD